MYLKTYFVVLVLVFHINSGVAQYFANHPPYVETPLSIPVAIVYDKPVVTLRPYNKAKVTTYRPKYSVVTEVSIGEENSNEKNLEIIKLTTAEVNETEIKAKPIGVKVIQSEALVSKTEEAVIATEPAVTKTVAEVTATQRAVITTEDVLIATEAVETETKAEVTATEVNFTENDVTVTETDIFTEQTPKLPTYRRIYTPKKTTPIRKYTDISKLRQQKYNKVVIQKFKPKTDVNDEYQVPVVVVYDDQDESRRNYLSRPRKFKNITQRRRFKPKASNNIENVLITEIKNESPQIITTNESAIQNFENSAIILERESELNYKTSTTLNTEQKKSAIPQNLDTTLSVNTRVMNTPVKIATSKLSKSPSTNVDTQVKTQRRRLKVKTAENTDNAPKYSKTSTTVFYTKGGTGSPQILTTQKSTIQNSENFTSIESTKVTEKLSTLTINNESEQQDSTASLNTIVSNRLLKMTAEEESVLKQPSAFTKTRIQRRRFKVKTAQNTDNALKYSKTIVSPEIKTEPPQKVTTQGSTSQNSKTFTSVVSTKVSNKPSVSTIDNDSEKQDSKHFTASVNTRISNRPLEITAVKNNVPIQPSAFVNAKTRTRRRRLKVKTAENADNALKYSKTIINTEIITKPPQILTTQESTTLNSETFTSVVNTKVTNKPLPTKLNKESVLQILDPSTSFVQTKVSNRPLEITTVKESVQPFAFVDTKTITQRRRLKIKTAENTDNALIYSKTVEETEPLQKVRTQESTAQNSKTLSSVLNTKLTNNPSTTKIQEKSVLKPSEETGFIKTRELNRLLQIKTVKESVKPSTFVDTRNKTRIQRRRFKINAAENTDNALRYSKTFLNTEIKAEPQQAVTTQKSTTLNSETLTSVVNTKVTNKPLPIKLNKESVVQTLEPSTGFVQKRVSNRPLEITTVKESVLPSALVDTITRTQIRRFKVKTAENIDNALLYSKTVVETEPLQKLRTQESTAQNSKTLTSVLNNNVTNNSSTVNIREQSELKPLEESGFMSTTVLNRPLQITTVKETEKPSFFVDTSNKTRLQRRRFKVNTVKNTDSALRYSKTLVNTEMKIEPLQAITTQELTSQNSETANVLDTIITRKKSQIMTAANSKNQNSGPFVSVGNTKVTSRIPQLTEKETVTLVPRAFQAYDYVNDPVVTLKNSESYVLKTEEITKPLQMEPTSKSVSHNSAMFTSVVNTEVTNNPLATILTKESATQNSKNFTFDVNTRVSSNPSQTLAAKKSSEEFNAQILSRSSQVRTVKDSSPQNFATYTSFETTKQSSRLPQITAKESALLNSKSSTAVNNIVRSKSSQLIDSALQNSGTYTSFENTRESNRVPQNIAKETTLPNYNSSAVVTTRVKSKSSQMIDSAPQNFETFTSVVNTEVTNNPLATIFTKESASQNSKNFTFDVNTRVSSNPSQTLAAKKSSEEVNAQIISRSSQVRTVKDSSPQNSATYTLFENTRQSSRLPQITAKESALLDSKSSTAVRSKSSQLIDSALQNSGTYTTFKNTRESNRVPQIIAKETILPNQNFSAVVTTRVRSKSSQIIESAPQNFETFTSVVNTRLTSRPSKITAKDTVTVVPKIFPKRTYEYVKESVVPIVDSESYVFSDSGNYHYRYEGADGTKAFERGELKEYNNDLTGEAVVGGFSYKDNDGNDFSISYTADENGYRPVGAHLPTPPPIPPAIARALAYLATKTTDPDSTTESM